MIKNIWRDAVLSAVYRVVDSNYAFNRTVLIDRELSNVVAETRSQGATPEQTLSRILQELRDEGVIEFLGGGSYRLVLPRLVTTTDVDVEQIELQNEHIDQAIRNNRLHIGVVETGSALGVARRRKGQARLRELTLENYGYSCALCDVIDRRLLITSHVLSWAEGPTARGRLDNAICLCRFHDSLFETGYWSLTDDFRLVRRLNVSSSTIQFLLRNDVRFRLPRTNSPAPIFLQHHRTHHKFDGK